MGRLKKPLKLKVNGNKCTIVFQVNTYNHIEGGKRIIHVTAVLDYTSFLNRMKLEGIVSARITNKF